MSNTSGKKLKIPNPKKLKDKVEFSDLSKTLTDKLTKIEKKEQGIFFTPPKTIVNTITKVKSVSSLFQDLIVTFIFIFISPYPIKLSAISISIRNN